MGGNSQSVSPPDGLCLDLAPESLHRQARSLLPDHQLAQFCSSFGGHPVQALVLKDWKRWLRKGKCLQSRSSAPETSLAWPPIVQQPLERVLGPPGPQMATPLQSTKYSGGCRWRAAGARSLVATSRSARESRGLSLSGSSSLPPPSHAPPAAREASRPSSPSEPGCSGGMLRVRRSQTAEEEKEMVGRKDWGGGRRPGKSQAKGQGGRRRGERAGISSKIGGSAGLLRVADSRGQPRPERRADLTPGAGLQPRVPLARSHAGANRLP